MSSYSTPPSRSPQSAHQRPSSSLGAPHGQASVAPQVQPTLYLPEHNALSRLTSHSTHASHPTHAHSASHPHNTHNAQHPQHPQHAQHSHSASHGGLTSAPIAPQSQPAPQGQQGGQQSAPDAHHGLARLNSAVAPSVAQVVSQSRPDGQPGPRKRQRTAAAAAAQGAQNPPNQGQNQAQNQGQGQQNGVGANGASATNGTAGGGAGGGGSGGSGGGGSGGGGAAGRASGQPRLRPAPAPAPPGAPAGIPTLRVMEVHGSETFAIPLSICESWETLLPLLRQTFNHSGTPKILTARGDTIAKPLLKHFLTDGVLLLVSFARANAKSAAAAAAAAANPTSAPTSSANAGASASTDPPTPYSPPVGNTQLSPFPSPAATSPASDIPTYKLSRTLHAVHELWREWTQGLGNGLPSVSSLEQRYGPKWRTSQAERKFFSRRKVIIDEVKRLIAEGRQEWDAVADVETWRQGRSLDALSKAIVERRRKGGVGVETVAGAGGGGGGVAGVGVLVDAEGEEGEGEWA